MSGLAMPTDLSKTFFSYSREDSEFVLRLVEDLRAAGADVWLDQLDVGPGQHWDTEIENALQQCPSHVTVLSPNSVESANVMDEVSYALQERKRVIPLLYRDCSVPFRLRRVQYIDFRTEYAEGLRYLLTALGVTTEQVVAGTPGTTEHSGRAVSTAAQSVQEVELETQKHELVEVRACTPELLEPGPVEARVSAHEPRQSWLQVLATVTAGKKRWIAVGGIVMLALVLLWRMAADRGSDARNNGASPTRAVVGDPESFLLSGKDHMDAKKYDDAINAFDQAIRLKPDYTEAFMDRGIAHDEKGEHDMAIQDYEEALRLKPDYAKAFLNRGVAYDAKGEYDRAIQDFNQALKLNPSDANPYNNRGNSYKNKGEYDRAIQDYNQALRLNSTSAIPYCNRGLVYYFKDENDRAIRDYNQALKLDPAYSECYNDRGLAYERKGDPGQALQDYDEALKLDPNYVKAQRNRERVVARLKK
jgi:Flp pilus assembly protein TadD